MIPVIFIHAGDQDYLKTAIKQAERYNERVVLIGDEKNKTFAKEWVPWKKLYHHHFAQVYQHMNWTHQSQILRNIERWFAISRWMEWKKEERAFCVDSDVMLYADLDEVIETWPSPAAGLAIPRKAWPAGVSASGHCSYWTQAAIKDFCDFVYRMYTTDRGLACLQYKWAAHILTKSPGGVCDMTLLYIWSIGKDVVSPEEIHGEFIGLAKFTKSAADAMSAAYHWVAEERPTAPFQCAVSLEKAYLTDMIQELVDNGWLVEGVDITGGWMEIDTAQDLERAKRLYGT